MFKPRVVLADDHVLLLEAFCKLLEPKYDVVGTAADGREALREVAKTKPDVLVMDVSMPTMGGFAAAERLKRKHPDIKLVFLTVNEDPDMVAEAFRLGAKGYILKSSAASELFEVLEVVLKGGTYVTPELAEGMISSFINNPNGEDSQTTLTLRQREVLQLLAEGNTMKQVASMLHITPRTVAFHKYQMMDMLNIKTNSALIQYAVKRGIAN